jgi:hypothetical protein
VVAEEFYVGAMVFHCADIAYIMTPQQPIAHQQSLSLSFFSHMAESVKKLMVIIVARIHSDLCVLM